MNIGKQLKDGFLTQNPVLVQLLGMCSTLAITTTIANGIGMGASVTIILTLSNIIISLLRKVIPEQVRIACYIVVIAGFVTMVAVNGGGYGLILAGEGLRPGQDDAVDHDEGDEHPQALGDVGEERLEQQVHHSDEARDHYDVAGDAHLFGALP